MATLVCTEKGKPILFSEARESISENSMRPYRAPQRELLLLPV